MPASHRCRCATTTDAIARLQPLAAACQQQRRLPLRAMHVAVASSTTSSSGSTPPRVIQVRSASRIGHGDRGVNRARIEALRRSSAGLVMAPAAASMPGADRRHAGAASRPPAPAPPALAAAPRTVAPMPLVHRPAPCDDRQHRHRQPGGHNLAACTRVRCARHWWWARCAWGSSTAIEHRGFAIKLLYSVCIGVACTAIVQGTRLGWVIDRTRRAGMPTGAQPLGWRGVVPGALLSVLLGPAAGLWLGDQLSRRAPACSTSTPSLLFSVLATVIAVVVVSALDRLASARARPRPRRSRPPNASCACCRASSNRTCCSTRWPTCVC